MLGTALLPDKSETGFWYLRRQTDAKQNYQEPLPTQTLFGIYEPRELWFRGVYQIL